MPLLKYLLLLLTACLFQVVSNVSHAESWLEKLETADEIRSSDPEKFQSILLETSDNLSSLSPYERDYLSYLQAYELTFKGKFALGMAAFETLAKTTTSGEIKVRSLLTLTNAYAIQRRWNEGLETLAQVQSLLATVNNSEIKIQAIATSGIFYNEIGQYELAQDYSERLKRISSSARNACVAEQLMFEALVKSHAQDSELIAKFESGSSLCLSAKENVAFSIIIRLYAQYLLETHNHPQAAKSLLDENEPQVLNAKYAPVIAIYQSLQAKANWELGQQEKAYQQALAVSQSPAAANALEALIRANKVLFDYHSSRGNSEAALEAYIKYAEADKAYLDEVKTKTLAFQLAQHQSLEQQNKIALLDEQNKLLKVQQQLDTAERFNSRLMIGALLSVILGLITWGWHSLKNQRRLKQLAEYDSLTGLLSRGHFTQVAQSALTHAQTLKAPVSCVLFDVDHFKRINDCFGHATGDWALKQVASLCREQVREFEIFGRIGGEEFCLILPECDSAHARVIADKLRRTLASCDTSASGNDFVLTASFGLTDSQQAGYSLDQLLAQADRAMYSAKRAGRNQVKAYSRDHDEASVDQTDEEQTQAGDARTQTSADAELGHSPIR
ncbi:GGDEF domain-containing protein [Shewanella sp. 3B26]|uniref:diguanylate cyclase n=1 Tax=Shewanella zhuhaiensis TaxID=2919576 RepID=A0AAJ1BE97_9GAMM|nr:GGDEF domain-containing protein [Shewanella zhuhaiensis]MCH4293168.1 GGDEF domain-containing protein [Shewanella zhuhaiensis]